ncbi:hypothetical protein DFH06DRAFT_529018 [Mycena polygramma]|nr:hypothetical protein DFH06DRAFT_529018 [Mycena polygramma]
MESATTGYLKQVQPLIKHKTICFDYIPKPTPKMFPVRTIRLTVCPWQDSMRYRQLSGAIELTRSSMRRRSSSSNCCPSKGGPSITRRRFPPRTFTARSSPENIQRRRP